MYIVSTQSYRTAPITHHEPAKVLLLLGAGRAVIERRKRRAARAQLLIGSIGGVIERYRNVVLLDGLAGLGPMLACQRIFHAYCRRAHQ